MSGGIRYGGHFRSWTVDEFREWLNSFSRPESIRDSIAICGKPRVRVPVDRQVPNEADL